MKTTLHDLLWRQVDEARQTGKDGLALANLAYMQSSLSPQTGELVQVPVDRMARSSCVDAAVPGSI